MKTDRVSYYFLKEKWNLLVVALTGIIYNVGLTFTPWFEGKMVQYLCDILGGTKEVSSMILLCICYVITVFVVQLMRYFKRLYVRKFANSINKNMRMTVFNNLLNSGLKDSENTGTVMTKVISDVESCAEGMRKFTTELFDTGVVMISYMVMLLIYDCKLTLVCMIFPLIAYILAEKLKTVVERNVRKYKESTALLNSASFERIDNALTYRVYGQESNRNALFENNLLDYENKAVRANIYENSMQPLYQLICMTGAVLVIIYGVLNIQKSIWDIAAFTTYFSCYQKLALKSSKAAKLFNAVQKAEVSWKRIKPYLRYCDYDKDEEMDFGKELSVNNVSFGYHDGDILLNNISFKAKPGEIIGITGRVASGKTTFGKLFIGELSYTGDIFLGNKLLRETDVGYMGHDAELFSGSIEENIKMGKEGDISEVLKAVCLDEEIKEFPDGLDTVVGDNERLSGGQKSRLILSRTLYHKKPLMILDDPFSAVDMKTEEKVFNNMQKICSDSIVLLISHRLSLFDKLNKVIYIGNGNVTVSKHEELLQNCSDYRQLYYAQRKEAGHEK